jgi:site-specific DNA recombinase
VIAKRSYTAAHGPAEEHGERTTLTSNRPVRQHLLDKVVWDEIVRLLENPCLIDEELTRRLEVAQEASPTQKRQESLQRDLTRTRKSMERLLAAYQEDLLSLDELRNRMPELRQREQAMHDTHLRPET